MSIKELIAKYGYSIALTDDKKRTVILVTKKCTELEAKKIANNHFKCPWIMLHSYNAWLKDDKVYFCQKNDAKSMWAISRTRLG